MSRRSTVVAYYGGSRPPVGARRVRMASPGRTFRGRRAQGTIVRGYTRRAGFYGRYNMGGDSEGELKFFDAAIDDAVIAPGGTINNTIDLIPQEVTESQRIGRKCTLKSIEMRYRINLPEVDAAATPSEGDVGRLIVYQDKQTNGAGAAVADLMAQVTVNGFFNLVNKGRFKILIDRTHKLNYAGLASDGAAVVSQANVEEFHKWTKRVNIPLEFDSTTGAITEMRSNHIGFLVIGTNTVMGLNSQFRVRFSG